MSEKAWPGGAIEPPPIARRGFDLASYVAREHERLASGPTMAQWLEKVREHPLPTLTTDEIVRAIREQRDADDPRDLG